MQLWKSLKPMMKKSRRPKDNCPHCYGEGKMEVGGDFEPAGCDRPTWVAYYEPCRCLRRWHDKLRDWWRWNNPRWWFVPEEIPF